MKKILLIVSLLSARIAIRNANTPKAYISDHIRYSYVYNTNFELLLPLTTNVEVLLTYYYEVRTVNNVLFEKTSQVVRTIGPNRTIHISIPISKGKHAEGRNYITFFYRFDNDAWKIIYSDFYTVNNQNVTELADESPIYASFNNEIKYSYLGKSSSASVVRAKYDTTTYTQERSFKHDLLFDFNVLSANFYYFEDEIEYDLALLHLKNTSLFPLLRNRFGNPYVELKIEYRNNRIVYFLKKPIYVDEQTHLMSFQNGPGYKLTNNLYFPKNKFEELQNLECYLEVIGFGKSKLHFTYTFNITIEERYFGQDGYYQIFITRG